MVDFDEVDVTQLESHMPGASSVYEASDWWGLARVATVALIRLTVIIDEIEGHVAAIAVKAEGDE